MKIGNPGVAGWGWRVRRPRAARAPCLHKTRAAVDRLLQDPAILRATTAPLVADVRAVCGLSLSAAYRAVALARGAVA